MVETVDAPAGLWEDGEEDLTREQIRAVLERQFPGGNAYALPNLAPPRARHPLEGMPTGFADLDALMGGLRGGELVVVAGRASSGKSTLLQNLARKALLQKETGTVALVSLESGKEQIARRLLCSQARLDTHDPAAGISQTDMRRRASEAHDLLLKGNLLISDAWDLTVDDLVRHCEATHRRSPLTMLLVDGVDRIPTHKSGKSAMSDVVEALVQIARSLQVPVVASCAIPYGEDHPADDTARPRECAAGPARNETSGETSLQIRDLPWAVSLNADVVLSLSRPLSDTMSEPASSKGLELLLLSVMRHPLRYRGSAPIAFFPRWGRMGGIRWEWPAGSAASLPQ